jgi:hypothetical protein
MKRLPIVLLLITACDLQAFAHQYFPAMHSSKDQKQVVEAVLRYELAHKKGIVFLRILGGDPPDELVQALSDLPVRILPGSRAELEARGFSTATMIPHVYKDQVSGKEGLLLDVHTVVWPKEGCAKMLAGFDGAPSAFRVTLEKNQWKVRPAGLKGALTFEGFMPEMGSLALDLTCK